MMENKEFDFLRIVEQKLRDSGIIELIQSEVQNRPALWGQDDQKTCWLTSCNLQICFNVRDESEIATAKPFFMFSIGSFDAAHLNMTVHDDTEYDTIYYKGEVTHDDKRKR